MSSLMNTPPSGPPRVIPVHDASDFLALVPQLLGFLPENSLALVAFRGNRTCGAMRFNLPDGGAPREVLKRIATTIIGTLCKIPGVEGVVPIIYTGERLASASVLPQRLFVETLIDRALLSGFRVRDALCVGADAWAEYSPAEFAPDERAPDEPADPTPPATMHPLAEIAASAVHAALPDSGQHDLASLRTGAQLPAVSRAEKERSTRAFRRLAQRIGAEVSDTGFAGLYGAVLDPVGLVEASRAWNPKTPDPDDVARLLLASQRPAQRDQMMLQFGFGREVGAVIHESNLRYEFLQSTTGLSLDEIIEVELRAGGPDLDTDASGSSLILGLSPTRPDVGQIERAIALLKTVVALAPRAARPAPLCMLAWLSWALGRGSIGGMFVDQAVQIEPDYSMALLLDRLLGSGRIPEWAFAVSTED